MNDEFGRGSADRARTRREHEDGGDRQRGGGSGRTRATGQDGKSREVIRDYRDLRVYQGAIEAAMQLLEITKGFPAEERGAMVAQMRRSSRSVCASIGEAWRRRRSQTDFVARLSNSAAQAEETRVWIDLASRCRYLTAEQENELSQRYDRICAQLAKMTSEAERWTVGQSKN